MPRTCAHFLSGGRTRGGRVRLLTGAFCGTAMLVIAGCSSGSPPHSNSSNSSPGTAGVGSGLPARQAVYLGLQQSKRDTSALGTIDVQVTGTSSSTSTGTMEMVFKPSTLISSAMKIASASKVTTMDEITAGSTLYLKLPSLAVATGKPWAAVPSPAGSASAGSASMTTPNPLEDIQLLLTAGDLHAAGTQIVDGVNTSVYEGSYPASSALDGMKASELKSIGSTLHGSIDETVWLDAQHQLRRVVTTEDVSGLTITITMDITAVNVPLHITLPPSNQVSHLSLSDLGH
jgi:hypothetical protein